MFLVATGLPGAEGRSVEKIGKKKLSNNNPNEERGKITDWNETEHDIRKDL